ncbi:endonuclease/Exonuclease/phosphatase [Phlyctema vagabunda]|uniref:Endonuclease/Exonuclease/phosphatase n=1 Tax=Phlyctema vagabunda TaxID=108571 RepID=A0ABR4PP99_9HELO
MADGYRFPQQTAGTFYYPQQHAQQQHHHPRHLVRNATPPNNIRSIFNNDTPSPSRSPDSHSPAQQSLYGMFNQNQQHGQHGRVNGGPGGQRMPLMYNYQHQNSHQPQQHTQHHTALTQEHTAHQTNGTVIGHHSSYSSGVLSSSTPNFTPNSLQNGHSTTTRGGSAQQINEHWAEQLKLHKETERAHASMVEQHAPHHYARLRAGENRGLNLASASAVVTAPTTTAQDGDKKDRGRPSNLDYMVKRQDWHNMDLSGQGLRVLSTPLFSYTFLSELYVASNKISQIPASIGQLRFLKFLDASNNMLTELPAELGMCVYLEHLLLFDNNIRTLPNELGSLFQLKMLGIEGNTNLDSGLKQEIMDRGTKALITHLREQAPVPLPPAPRQMLDLQGGTPGHANQDRFKVLCYNILCDNYVTPQLYGFTPSGALAWDYRKEQILQEIQAHDADILCLQEVDTDTFQEFFSMKLAYGHYKGILHKKTRAKTMNEKDAKIVDGCATFYKSNKYILLDKQTIDFANVAINRPDMKNQHDIFNRVMPRDNIAAITFLENRLTGARIIVVNTHLHWDPAEADVKLIQIAILMDNVTKLAEKYARWPACKDKKTYTLIDTDADPDVPVEPVPEPAPSMEYSSSTQIPLLVCGDLNSTINSSVYELLSTGHVAADHQEIGSYQYGNFTRDGIQHPFSLRSAYTLLNGTPDALPFTNYTPNFRDMIDHIWYSTNALEVTSLLGPVDSEYMKRVPGFPNYHFPSDHLSLVSEFSVKGRKEKKNLPEPDFGPQRNDRRRD